MAVTHVATALALEGLFFASQYLVFAEGTLLGGVNLGAVFKLMRVGELLLQGLGEFALWGVG